MEYIENATVLKSFIDENISGKIDVVHLLDFIGRGLGTVIAKLHSKHIIHGDLTTSNILLKNNSIESLYNNPSGGKLFTMAFLFAHNKRFNVALNHECGKR